MALAAAGLTPTDPLKSYHSPALRTRYRPEEPKLPTIRTNPVYADIKFEPEKDKYHARPAARVRAGGLESKVSEGRPKTLKDPLVWASTDFQDEIEYVCCLSAAEKAEIMSALSHSKGAVDLRWRWLTIE